VGAFKIRNETSYGIQFHPEVYHTTDGKKILKNFVLNICGCRQDWTPDSFVETTVANLKKKLGKDKVVLGLSGGVDSSVAAILLKKAIGDKRFGAGLRWKRLSGSFVYYDQGSF